MNTAPVRTLQQHALLITEDPQIIDDVVHLAAAAGAEIFVAPTPTRSQWAASPLVLIGGDALAGLVRVPLERRRDVVVILAEREDPARQKTGTPEPWRDAVAIGAEHVIVLPDAARWLSDRLGSVAEGPCRNGAVIGVEGVVGGVGASTLACAMALSARRSGRSVLLIDGDPRGGGVDLVLGAESLGGARWDDVADVTGVGDLDRAMGRISAASLDEAVPHPHGIAMLSFGRGTVTMPDPDAVTAVLEAGARGYDLVVIDRARGVWDDQAHMQHLFVLVPNRIRGISAAAAALPRLAALATDCHVALRRSPRGVSTADAERSLATKVIAEIGDDARVLAATESGELIPDQLVRSAAVILERAGLIVAEPRPIGARVLASGRPAA